MLFQGAVCAIFLIQGGLCKTNSTPQALNPQLTNIVPNGNGPILYYNGSGPVPPYDMLSPSPPPLPLLTQQQIEDAIFAEIVAIANSSYSLKDNCSQCIATTELLHIAAITQPVDTVTNLLIRYCNAFPSEVTIFAASCEQEYSGIGNEGGYYAQLFAKMSQATGDMTAYCYYNFEVCTRPPVIMINESEWFTPKPQGQVAPAPSNKTINVLHLTDWHIDPRYDIGSEADCSQYLCCRPYSTNTKLDTFTANASVPASRFGYLYCDAPADLALSVFTEMPQFINMSELAFTIFTGDIVSHDNDDQLSQAYIEYSEMITYQTFKANLGNIVSLHLTNSLIF
jgi:sphingomyelin phosphodiesterase